MKKMLNLKKLTAFAIVIVIVEILAPVSTYAQELGKLFMEVTDRNGQAVTDLTPDEFVVQENQIECEIVSADSGITPMKIALMVDNGDIINQTGGVNSLRDGLESFLDTLPAQHEISLFTIGGTVRRRVDFTTDRLELKESTKGIFAERGAGVRMLDGVRETWDRRFEGNESWPVFVLVVTDGAEQSSFMNDTRYNEWLTSLLQAGVQIHVIMVSSRGGNSYALSNQMAITDYSLSFTQNTGGIYTAIATVTGVVDALTTLATRMSTHYDKVSNRYRVIYKRPDTPGANLLAGVTRPNTNVRLFVDRSIE